MVMRRTTIKNTITMILIMISIVDFFDFLQILIGDHMNDTIRLITCHKTDSGIEGNKVFFN